jgi:hypothetical protein
MKGGLASIFFVRVQSVFHPSLNKISYGLPGETRAGFHPWQKQETRTGTSNHRFGKNMREDNARSSPGWKNRERKLT